MSQGWRRFLAAALVALMMVALAGVAGCTADETGDETAATEATGGEDATTDADTTDAGTETADEEIDDATAAEMMDDAKDMAQAWMVGPGSDLTADDFTFTTETMVQDDEGGWWARVSAAPVDMSYETEQIYMHLPPGATIWQFFDSGTGIEPPIDDRFPEEIRDLL